MYICLKFYMANEIRKVEIRNMFVEMGESLVQEGFDLKDYSIAQAGTIMIILAAVLMSEEDTLIFSEICSMFSAKKILMDIQGDDNHALSDMLKKRMEEAKAKAIVAPAIPPKPTPKTRRRKGGEETK